MLVTGGETLVGSTLAPTNAAELYTPPQNTWRSAGLLVTARSSAAAVLGANGTVIVVGGTGSSGQSLTATESYDPSTNS